MPTDPRLTNLQLLTLAAFRLQQRQAQPPPGRKVVVRVVYEDPLGEGPLEGPEYVYYVPENGPAWRADDAS